MHLQQLDLIRFSILTKFGSVQILRRFYTSCSFGKQTYAWMILKEMRTEHRVLHEACIDLGIKKDALHK